MVKKWWEMYGPEVTGSLDIDHEFMARVLDDCDNKKWLACPSCRWHFEEALRIKSEEIDKLKQDIEELKSKNKSLDFKYRVNQAFGGYVGHIASLNEKIKALEKENEDLKNTISRCKEEIDDKDKLIEELKSKNRMLKLRTIMTPDCYGLYSVNNELNEKFKALEKENKDLKDTLDKAEEVGKNIGKYVVECIREGSNKGIYKLNPDTRIDIHVEETNNVPMTFDRYAIPRIAIMFNNTQTEMERDTAEHECEELHEKIDSLWSVNDELNRKIKALEKENKGFKTALSMCERDINAAINLCNGAVFLSEQAQKKTPWFTNKIEEEK